MAEANRFTFTRTRILTLDRLVVVTETLGLLLDVPANPRNIVLLRFAPVIGAAARSG